MRQDEYSGDVMKISVFYDLAGYNIPCQVFNYTDPDSGRYKTIRTMVCNPSKELQELFTQTGFIEEK